MIDEGIARIVRGRRRSDGERGQWNHVPGPANKFHSFSPEFSLNKMRAMHTDRAGDRREVSAPASATTPAGRLTEMTK
jgi:hypothetical protein